MLWPCIRPSKNVHGSISTQSHGPISQAHFGRMGQGGKPVGFNSFAPNRKRKRTKQTTGNKKDLKTQKSSPGTNAVSNLAIAIPKMQQSLQGTSIKKCHEFDGYNPSLHYSNGIHFVPKFLLTTNKWTRQHAKFQQPTQGRGGTCSKKRRLYRLMRLPSLMQQNRTATNFPKANQHEKNATGWMCKSVQKQRRQNLFGVKISAANSGWWIKTLVGNKEKQT